jgi:CheY-like chemotaxis protein
MNPTQNRKKVLIVEDDDQLRSSLADGLGLFGYEILEASDGERAVQIVVDSAPDLILLDLLLPKLDGFKVLERIRHYPKTEIAETKVVVLSNLWSNKDILRAQALKIDEYYVKANTEVKDVFQKVHSLLA